MVGKTSTCSPLLAVKHNSRRVSRFRAGGISRFRAGGLQGSGQGGVSRFRAGEVSRIKAQGLGCRTMLCESGS